MHLDDNCVVCSMGVEEDLLHVCFGCPFAISCWSSLNLFLPNANNLEAILDSLARLARVSLRVSDPK